MIDRDATANAALLRKHRQSWIDGRPWQEGEGTLHHINPADGTQLGETERAGPQGVTAAIAAGRRSFAQWGGMPVGERKRLLLGFADAIASNIEDLALMEALEVGRPLSDATALLAQAPEILRRYIGFAEQAQGDVVATEQRQLGVSWRRPRGVVAAILPWNFPVMNVLVRLAPALAAGNCVVVKPSENSPRSAVMLAKLASEAGLPDGVFNVVLGAGDIGQALAEHADIDLVTFTGSTATGLAITRAAAAKTLKPVLMECGGKSPQIVLDDAFEDPAIWHAIFFSSFWNTGQWCAAKTRLLVPHARIGAAIEGLQQAASAWRIGNPLDEQTRLGPLVNAAQRDRVMSYYESARRLGTVVELDCPNDGLPQSGCFVLPSLALDQPRGSEVVRNEVFGPLLTLEGFEGIDDAIALANDTDYGLMASVWTNRASAAHRVARAVKAGGITVYSSAEAAMASVPDIVGSYLEPQKQSGHGLDGGVPGLLAYMTAQSVTWLH